MEDKLINIETAILAKQKGLYNEHIKDEDIIPCSQSSLQNWLMDEHKIYVLLYPHTHPSTMFELEPHRDDLRIRNLPGQLLFWYPRVYKFDQYEVLDGGLVGINDDYGVYNDYYKAFEVGLKNALNLVV